MAINFDEKINRIDTHCMKWDKVQDIYGVDPNEGIAMWVADMDFRPPQSVSDALQKMVDHGVFGYFGDDRDYKNAICSWMQRRHDWQIKPEWIFTTHGLVNGTAMCVQTFTKPGDGVILFTPVYHAFSRVIKANNRKLVESELHNIDGRYEMDFDALEAQMSGNERMVILCSPHNPGGRVWSVDELRQLADFCVRHDLVLVSDEIHHDLVFAGSKHTIMSKAAPEIIDRLVLMTATTKTFNIAGGHLGNVIIENSELREKFAASVLADAISGNSFGLFMAEAAYNGGEEWLNDLLEYLTENKRIFDEAINGIPGLKSMNLEATYLAWVDFSGTGMSTEEFTNRVQDVAKVAVNHGPTFGKGGENFLRFNLATQRDVVVDATERLREAFADLQ